MWWTIALGGIVHLITALSIGLGVDESYEVVVGRQLSWGYFDHPPLSFWMAHAAASLGGEHGIVVRLPFILLFACTTWVMYRFTARWFGERAGAIAALLINIAPVLAVSTGGWVLPDGPLVFGVVSGAYCLGRAILDPEEPHRWRWWIAAGIATGIALLSKYHGLLFLAGAFLFLCTRPIGRRWLTRPEPWIAAAIALGLFLPDVVWNGQHHWASFAFQLGRGARSTPPAIGTRLTALLQNIAGQNAALFPWIWIPLAVVFVRTLMKRPIEDREWLCLSLGAIPIVLFTAVALRGDPGLPHWPAPGWVMIIPLLAASAARRLERGDLRVRRWLVGSTVVFVGLVALLGVATATGWPTRLLPEGMPRDDRTLDALDWTSLPHGLDSLGLLHRPGTFVAGASWIQAAKIGYALGPSVQVVALSPDPRHFGFLYDLGDFTGQDAVILDRLPSSARLMPRLTQDFDSVAFVGRIPVRRMGETAFEVGVYLGHRFTAPAEPDRHY